MYFVLDHTKPRLGSGREGGNVMTGCNVLNAFLLDPYPPTTPLTRLDNYAVRFLLVTPPPPPPPQLPRLDRRGTRGRPAHTRTRYLVLARTSSGPSVLLVVPSRLVVCARASASSRRHVTPRERHHEVLPPAPGNFRFSSQTAGPGPQSSDIARFAPAENADHVSGRSSPGVSFLNGSSFVVFRNPKIPLSRARHLCPLLSADHRRDAPRYRRWLQANRPTIAAKGRAAVAAAVFVCTRYLKNASRSVYGGRKGLPAWPRHF